MRGSNGTNPAAGKRWLFPKSHVRMQDEISEALARSMRGDERVIAIARLVAEIHNDFRAIEAHTRAANERASAAQYEPPAVASMSRPRNERRTAERRSLVFA